MMKNMSDNGFLNRIFKTYYRQYKEQESSKFNFRQREFGFLFWDRNYMLRHKSFDHLEQLKDFLIKTGPRHVYSSGAIYEKPDNPNMDNKEYLYCDFIIDIDVDHFYTPCKEKHDRWLCKNCGNSGNGMIENCPKCKKAKIKSISWVCDDCLNHAKLEVFKIIDNFLIPDLGIDESEINITFSGHRGYHIKIENEQMRNLSSEFRREIVDYITGDNISFEVLGLKSINNVIYGFSRESIGWPKKIYSKLEEILKNYSVEALRNKLRSYELTGGNIETILNNKKRILYEIYQNEERVWRVGLSMKALYKLLDGLVKDIGGNIDEPVSIDIHRLIRYPYSLHGKTGFKAQPLKLHELDKFNPLNEQNKELDPIVFESKKNHNLEVIEEIPRMTIKGQPYGPYSLGQQIEVPNHIAILLLCKEVAKTI